MFRWVWRTLRATADIIGFYYDFAQTASFAAGGGMIASAVLLAQKIPIQIPIALGVIGAGLLTFAIVRAVDRNKRWLVTKDERAIVLDIPVILQKMYSKLCQLADTAATARISDEDDEAAKSMLAEAVFGDDREITNALKRRPKMKHLQDAVRVIAAYFDERNIGLKSLRDNDTTYTELEDQLLSASKLIDSEGIDNDIRGFKRLAHEACFGRMYERRFLGLDDMGTQARLGVRFQKLDEAMEKRLFHLRKRLIRYWRWER
ncbi:MAG: hypothetical protein ACUZ8A_06655 [Candidatus Bathyanammoxibius sp.]